VGTSCRFAYPLPGGNTGGPAERVPRCFTKGPGFAGLRAILG